jgi:nitroreductase
MQQKPADTQVEIHGIIKTRWSPRAFNPDKQVSHDDLFALMEAAHWAPSCFNDQPWRFVVCNKITDKISWEAALGIIVEKNRRWAKNAPLLILVVAMDHFNHNGQPNRWASYDTGAASVSLCLQATALGMCTHQMGGFNTDKAREVFNLPNNCSPISMIAVGYQDKVEVLDDDFKENELATRSRAPLNERFFVGQWGLGVE